METNRLGRDKRVAHPLGFLLFSRRGQSGSVGKNEWAGWRVGSMVSDLQLLVTRKEQSDCRSPEVATKR